MKEDAISRLHRDDGGVESRLQTIGAHDVHEQAVPRLVDIVDGAMEQGVVENEQRLLVPVMGLVVDIDEDILAVDRLEIVQHAEGQPQRAEMPRGFFAGVEHRHRNRLDVAISLLEGGNPHRDVLLLARTN